MMRSGVFSKVDLSGLVKSGRIIPLTGFQEKHIGPASIDLTVSDELYEVDKLFRPMSQDGETVRDMLDLCGRTKISLGHVMLPGHQYVAKASCDINFPSGVYAYTNAKSTSGRNFLFVRTLADGIGQFDTVDMRQNGYSGELWLVLQPLSYPVILSDKECYSQIRVFDGDTRLGEPGLRNILIESDILYRRNQEPYLQKDLSLFTNDGSIFCTLFAKGDKPVGYRLKNNSAPIDLSQRNLDPSLYFDPVYAKSIVSGDKTSWYVELIAGEHYLFSTNEMLKIPANLCAELRALDPRLGLFFSHFAGFFDPGFFGTATLEVVAPYDMVLRHKDPVARFVFEELRSDTQSYAEVGNYQLQIETQLPKQFRSFDI